MRSGSLPWLAPAVLLAATACSQASEEQSTSVKPSAAARPAEPVETAVPFNEGQARRILQMSPLPPLPPDPTNRYADDPRAAHLGQALFFDERLSANGAVSCATCHDPDRGFSDGRQLAMGQSLGNRHTPTLWNVAHHRWLTWDGRADSLWMQALDPIEDPREMGTTRGKLARVIAEDPALRAAYEAAFGPMDEAALRERPDDARPARGREAASGPGAPEPVRAWAALDQEERAAIDAVFVHAGKAMAAYQRLLVRGDAPFDRFVEGLRENDAEKVESLSAGAQRGLALFMGRANCILCHSGPNFSDGEFHNNALPTLHGGEARDSGRFDGAKVVAASSFNAAGPHSDQRDGPAALRVRQLRQSSEAWGEFRTPSLRNLAHRGPFMHQGQFEDLEGVIEFYSELKGATGRGHHQEQVLVPLRLSVGEKEDLRAFLAALEGRKAASQLLSPPSQSALAR